jgi:large subunit ribosomal protein L2
MLIVTVFFMGKRIMVQRHGSGSCQFTSPTHKRLGENRYRYMPKGTANMKATIKALVHEPGRGAPIGLIQFEDGFKNLYLPPEGAAVGDIIEMGDKVEIKVGNIMQIDHVPEGTYVYDIEGSQFDGGKFIRGSGTYGVVTTHGDRDVSVKMPSGQVKKFLKVCRCTIGVVSAGGRKIKPFVKAGNHHYWMETKHQIWPRVRGNVMNACSHPFGGGRHKAPHRPTTTKRGTPPGRAVGLIAARRTGWKGK